MAANDHYVPRFYLRRFAASDGRLWVWDKSSDRVFQTRPELVAAEKRFYQLDYLAEFGATAPRELERQLSQLEFDAARILERWVQQIASGTVEIPQQHRERMSLYLMVQLFRTREARAQLFEFVQKNISTPRCRRASV